MAASAASCVREEEAEAVQVGLRLGLVSHDDPEPARAAGAGLAHVHCRLGGSEALHALGEGCRVVEPEPATARLGQLARIGVLTVDAAPVGVPLGSGVDGASDETVAACRSRIAVASARRASSEPSRSSRSREASRRRLPSCASSTA